jgi:hypothetical protein
VKTPEQRMAIWKEQLRSMEASEAFRLLVDIAEQAIKENKELRKGGNRVDSN